MGLQLPPAIATFLTLGLMFYLFRRDIREKPNVSSAVWIPFLWLVVTCSRSVSQWLNIFGVPVAGAASVEEGSPLDASFYFVLSAAGFMVLQQRRVQLSELIQNNRWIAVFLGYCLISVIWSDLPFMAFKRWFKVLGLPIMALVILTERDPEEALSRLMKRVAYVIIPVSILFIKFYPHYGRTFEVWTGGAMNTGITENKNALGADCLILGFFLFWHLLRTWRSKRTRQRRRELWLVAGLSYGVYWLLSEASSATATISLLIGMAVVVFVGLRSVNKNLIGTYLLVGLVLFFIAEMAFGLSVAVSQSMGRGSGFSGRTILWSALLNGGTNPIFGTGYESFWVGQRPEQLLTGVFFFIPNEAHNGYLEIYLTLGLIGLFLLIGMFLAAFWKIRRQLFRNFDWARYCLGFFAAIVVYNWTEAGFKTIAPMSFMFYLIAIDYRPPRRATGQVSVERSQESRQFAYA